MIDREWKKEYKGNIIILWGRKLITSLFYFRGYRKLYPDRPWYMPNAHRFLEKKLPYIQRVFEYSCGDSSIWFAKHVKEYIAVEHDQTWHSRVTDMLSKDNLNSAKIYYAPADEKDIEFNWAEKWPHYTVLKRPPARPEYKNYISTIDQYPDSYFDCIIIDGRERLGCLVHAMPKLAQDGMIIFDDSARYYYQEAFSLLSDWYSISFRFGLGQTTFFERDKNLLKFSV